MTPLLIELQAMHSEIFLAISALVLLVVGAFSGNNSTYSISFLAAIALVFATYLQTRETESAVVFSGMFAVSSFAAFMKSAIYLSAFAVLTMSAGKYVQHSVSRFELPVLIVLSVVGMSMMVSANDTLALYMGLELTSLSLYVMAAFAREKEHATEAGLKYFVLGALASGMMLYGISLIFGFTGSTNYAKIAEAIGNVQRVSDIPPGVSLGIIFMLVGFFFKISAAPFHMWTPDVYQGAPTPVTAFFAASPKAAAIAALLRAVSGPFAEADIVWRDIVILVSVLTMAVGAFAAIKQTNIKRLFAYSSIGHVGYMLIGVAAFGSGGVHGVIVYISLYLFMTVGAFACVLHMQKNGEPVEEITDLAGASKTHPRLAIALSIILFSMAGIPPLAGFFGKMYVFLAAMEAGLYVVATIGVLTSVVAAYYYLRVVKVMYLDEVASALEPMRGFGTNIVLMVSALFTMFFFVYPTPLIDAAKRAAEAIVF